jgi:exodeoxyribonuclease VII large subunit
MRQELFVVPQMSASSQIPEFTVSEVSEALKITIEGNFSLIKIKGEISGIKAATSGHVYFNLKDEKSVIKAVCWRGVASSLNFKPEDGLEVICTGKLSIYAGGSYYQIVISSIEINGIGALLALLEKRKKQLEEEGLFALERKKPLPFMPKVLGIVTSLTGAVIRDILHRIADRFPLHVIIWPVLVQGHDAAEQIARAIKGFNNLPHHIPRPDTIIVARGGGSIEDLWAFNEEIVVRAAANSKIPLISAVGHETDTTLIDFASDKRAPTPTAAAEISVPVKADLEVTLASLHNRLNKALPNMIRLLNLKFNELSHALYRAEHILIKT